MSPSATPAKAAAPAASSGTLLQPKGCAPVPRRAWQDVAVIWGLLALFAAVASVVLFCFDPRQYHFYPVCFFHKTTGLLCPGCGALRATHQLLHGHLAAAWALNPLAVLLTPLFAWFGVDAVLTLVRGRGLPKSMPRPAVIWLGAAGLLAFGILRNLPGP